MRGIKFRGLRKDTCNFEIGHYYERNGKSFICSETHSDNADIYFNGEVLPDTVGQYVGKKDFNGDYIFDGDKFKGEEDRGYYLVVWNPIEARFQVDYYGYSMHHGEGSQEIYSDYVDLVDENVYEMSYLSEMEIIGNIHENPELLK